MADETHRRRPRCAADAAHAAAPGMPQLDFSTFPNQIFWLVVTLVAIYFILSKSRCRGSRPFWPSVRAR
jgi:F-type H+-transporting ATPase subunit b